MKSIRNIGQLPVGSALVSDDILEFHAARIMLLIHNCGTKKKGSEGKAIEGLTKLAKLDFFIRYPQFFNRAAIHLHKDSFIDSQEVESKMIRFHYGPWDKRYYHVLPFLEARGIIKIENNDKQYVFSLTQLGTELVKKLVKHSDYEDVVSKMKVVSKALRQYSGNRLKELVYEVFGDEVTRKNLNDIIELSDE